MSDVAKIRADIVTLTSTLVRYQGNARHEVGEPLIAGMRARTARLSAGTLPDTPIWRWAEACTALLDKIEYVGLHTGGYTPEIHTMYSHLLLMNYEDDKG